MSLEMAPARTIARMMRQWLDHKPTVEDVLPFCSMLDKGIVFLNSQGMVSTDAVLGAAVIAVRDYHTKHIFIDNLMKCVNGEDDYNSQKNFIQELCDTARITGAHIHVIHHVRKGRDEIEELNKFSFRGASAVVDQADNAIIIQRNRGKEQAIEKNGFDMTKDGIEPDTFLRIVKQRNGDFEGTVGLWFNKFRTAFCRDASRNPAFELSEAQKKMLESDESSPF
jgi:twinkle protein